MVTSTTTRMLRDEESIWQTMVRKSMVIVTLKTTFTRRTPAVLVSSMDTQGISCISANIALLLETML